MEHYIRHLLTLLDRLYRTLTKKLEKTEINSKNKFCKNIINKYLKAFEIIKPTDNN